MLIFTANAQIPGPSQPELLVCVGAPGCGKSTFARQYSDTYTIVSQDELGTWKACLERARKSLINSRSAIIDNTNRDLETRSILTEFVLVENFLIYNARFAQIDNWYVFLLFPENDILIWLIPWVYHVAVCFLNVLLRMLFTITRFAKFLMPTAEWRIKHTKMLTNLRFGHSFRLIT